MPLLSIIVPAKSQDSPGLQELKADIQKQGFKDWELLVSTQGGPEEAKARGALRAKGEVLAFFCTDNRIPSKDFLEILTRMARHPDVVGAFPDRYHYSWDESPLNRYFALIGDNDPLCVWLGKNDRTGWNHPPNFGLMSYASKMPSIGDNGFFVKAHLMQKVIKDPASHFCIDAVKDIVTRRHEYTFYRVPYPMAVLHRTGDSFWAYFERRFHYIRTLYFNRLKERQWKMVERKDGPRVLWFALASLLIFPHLFTAIYGYTRVRDWAWFLHPIVCLLMTCVYISLTLVHLLSAWWFPRWTGLRA